MDTKTTKMRRVCGALVLLMVVGCGENTPKPPPSRTENFEGFSCTVPENWYRGAIVQEQAKAILLYGTASSDAQTVIGVQVGKTMELSPEAMARQITEVMGELSKVPVTVDGDKGVWVTTGSDNLQFPREAVLVFHGGKAYVIGACSTDKKFDLHTPLDTVVKTWKWK